MRLRPALLGVGVCVVAGEATALVHAGSLATRGLATDVEVVEGRAYVVEAGTPGPAPLRQIRAGAALRSRP
jgi:hypothetical protein